MSSAAAKLRLPVFGEETLLEMLRSGVSAAQADRPDIAERRFRDALAAARGTGTRVELLACSHLGTLFAEQGRDVELLLLARHHARLAVAHGTPEDRCFALSGVACALAHIQEWTRLDEEAAKLERALDAYDGPHAAALRRHLHRMRVDRELARDDLPAARRELDCVLSLLVDHQESPSITRLNFTIEAEVLLREGRVELARSALGYAAVQDAAAAAANLECLYLEACCALELEGPERAAATIARTLELIDADRGAAFGTASRLRCAWRLADLAEEGCRDPALAKRVYDVAAAAVLVRAVEIERLVQRLPELGLPDAEDAASLSAYRARFAASQTKLLSSVSRLLMDRIAAGDVPTWTSDLRRGVVGVCAWCLHVLLPDGKTLPLGHFLAPSAGLRVSHGICRPCAIRMTGSFPIAAAPTSPA